VAATVRLGRISTDDVSVQLAHGAVGANNELVSPTITELKADVCQDGVCTYKGKFATDGAGLYGFAVRVVPAHPELANPMDLGLLTWA
jgi:starch phosphorylase